MANTLGFYNPAFYANEALIHLRKALGFANRIHLGYDAERRTFDRGDTINIKTPSTFTVQNAPATAEDLDTGSTSLILDQWKEVKFKLSDKELAFTGQQIINDHISPAAYAIADFIDQQGVALYADVPWYADATATPVPGDLAAAYKVLFNNNVPVWDQQNLHMMIDGDMQEALTSNSAFAQHQGAGSEGVATQMRGTLGRKYGFEVFANQNTPSHTKGTASTPTLAVDGLTAKGATTINLDAGTVTGTLVPGDTFVIAGNTQRYAVTNTVTAATNAFVGVEITPALVEAAADDAVVTASLDNHVSNLGFHRNFAAIAFGKLPVMGRELGAKVASVQDPVTGLAIRSRMYYVGNSSEVHVALDVLFGYKTLNPNLAMRLRG